MAKHEIEITAPKLELGKGDTGIELNVISVDGKNGKHSKYGTLKISKGLLQWFPAGAQTPIKFTWEEFKKLIEADVKKKGKKLMNRTRSSPKNIAPSVAKNGIKKW